MKYEYEIFFESHHDEICQINGWWPIATNMIKRPEKIEHYIKSGLLRRIAPEKIGAVEDKQELKIIEKAFLAGRSKTSWEQFKRDYGLDKSSQSEAWKELIDLYDTIDRQSYGYGALINELSKLFTITRKEVN